jgi:uncharacterized protein (DUF427 family)
MWEYRGQKRPSFAEQPTADQESVWDYPRPPLVRGCARLVVVRSSGIVLARSRETYRVLETASPPSFYLPEKDVDWEQLAQAPGSSLCEWKGVAQYWNLSTDPRGAPVGWSYGDPNPNFKMLRGYISFYPGRVACYVNGEKVRPQPGYFYGGWITSEVVGPFKGAPGTEHW